MKLAIYCITLNEAKFVDRMIESVIDDADEIVIVDTGSTDGTIKKINAWCKKNKKVKLFHMHIKPWRFDVARNVSLAHVSPDMDVCLSLDLDEVMIPGWRQEIEKVWVPGETTRCSYQYIWSFKPDGTPDVSFSTDKLHARSGYDWHHPVHETLRPYFITEVHAKSKAIMHHYPDSTKSRGQYMRLLELSVAEAPYDDRNCYYLAREYFYYDQWQKAIDQFEVYRKLSTALWHAERGSSWRLSGRCHIRLGNSEAAMQCFQQATVECPEMRESWVELAECLYQRQEWAQCFAACERAVAITEIPDVYITERDAYGAKAHDIMCVAAWNLGLRDTAIEQITIALCHEPHNERFKGNLELMLRETGA